MGGNLLLDYMEENEIWHLPHGNLKDQNDRRDTGASDTSRPFASNEAGQCTRNQPCRCMKGRARASTSLSNLFIYCLNTSTLRGEEHLLNPYIYCLNTRILRRDFEERLISLFIYCLNTRTLREEEHLIMGLGRWLEQVGWRAPGAAWQFGRTRRCWGFKVSTWTDTLLRPIRQRRPILSPRSSSPGTLQGL